MKEKQLHIRVSDKFKALIYKKAQKRGMTISEYIRYIVRREVEDEK